MDDYISRKAIMDAYEEEQRKNGPWRFEAIIESVPAANVRSVVHGRWENCYRQQRKRIYGLL